jgi:hypothetical protein
MNGISLANCSPQNQMSGGTPTFRRSPRQGYPTPWSGVAMTSALGFTPEHYAAARRTSGERAWHALYEGTPSSPEGGLVKAQWVDDWRLPAAPTMTVVGVDQSDSGQGDSAGIVAASLTRDGVVEHSVSDAVHGSATTPTSIVVIT